MRNLIINVQTFLEGEQFLSAFIKKKYKIL